MASMTMTWDDWGFVLSSQHRKNILELLENDSLTPTNISTKLNLHVSQTARSLHELENKNLIECLNPSLRKGRIYSITQKGLETLELKREKHGA